jgi:trk system potassium uptake protein
VKSFFTDNRSFAQGLGPNLSQERILKWPIILRTLGVLWVLCGLVLLVPAAISCFYHEQEWDNFLGLAIFVVLWGGSLALGFYKKESHVFRWREGVIVTALSWVSVSGIFALPFYFCSATIAWIDGLFQSISSLTTTGLSTIQEPLPISMVVWKLFLQWLGGFGIVMMAGTVLPLLNISGVRIVLAEFSDQSEKTMPRFSGMILRVLFMYTGLTITCIMALSMLGLDFFQSFSYAIAASSTGGCIDSPQRLDQLGGCVKVVLTVCMLLSSCPLVLLADLAQGRWRQFFHNQQVIGYLRVYSMALFLTVWGLYRLKHWVPWMDVFFSVASVMTTTGFEIHPALRKGCFSLLLLGLGLIGGCAGSSAGGLKIYRLQILMGLAKNQMQQSLTPHRFRPVVYNKEVVGQETINGVVVACFIFMAALGIIALAMSYHGLTPGQSLELSFTALTSMGSFLGQDFLFHEVPSGVKVLTMAGMLLGRLELTAILVLMMLPFSKS